MAAQKGPFRCDHCHEFRAPDGCIKVAGKIEPAACCNLYDPMLAKGVNPHEPISASSVTRVRVYVYNAEGKLLALRRKRHDDENHNPPGTWEMIQGKVNPGEKIEDAALRELREEVGYLPSDLQSWRELTHPYTWEAVLGPWVRRKPNIEDNPDKEHDTFAWESPRIALQWMGRRIAKAAIDPIERIVRAIAWDDWDGLTKLIAPELGEAASEGVVQGMDDVGSSDDEAFSLANADAIDYAVTRSAALIDPISQTTKNGLRSLLEQALVDGWSGQQLAQAIADSSLFSPDRADRIARTELAMATSQGNLTAWRRSGVVTGKKWIIADTHDDDDVCDRNAEAGVIPLDQAFPSGDDGPPAHPNCKCVVVPVVQGAAA